VTIHRRADSLVKYLIPTFTVFLLLLGLLTLFVTLRSGVTVYTICLVLSTFAGLVTYLSNKRRGLDIIFIVSIAWLLRYFERSSFLLLYDSEITRRWLLVLPVIFVATPLAFLSYVNRQRLLSKKADLKRLAITIVLIPLISLLSFMRKPYTNEYNCWYYFNDTKGNYKIVFALTPEHLFEVYSGSQELEDFIQKNGIVVPNREGIYCPETKLQIITRFKRIVSVSVVEFHNTKKDQYFNLPYSIDLDYSLIKGDKSILEPRFTL
jgi:hypothetical protein